LTLRRNTRNRPSAGAPFNGHWTHVVYRFPKPITVAPGDLVPLVVRHYRTQITVDLVEERVAAVGADVLLTHFGDDVIRLTQSRAL
jgi:hypothetical protein